MDDTITVELDRDTLRELNDRAERHGLSVSAEVGVIVRERLGQGRPTTDWVARAHAIRAMTPPGSIHVDSWKLIRASRDWDH